SMAPPIVRSSHSVAWTSIAILAAACSSASQGGSSGAAPSPVAASATRNPNSLAAQPRKTGAIGDVENFGVKVTGVGYGPDRATYELTRASYVAMLVVTDSGIGAIMPLREFPAQLQGGGAHTNSLLATDKGMGGADRFGARR